MVSHVLSERIRSCKSPAYGKLAMFFFFVSLAVIIHYFHEAWRDEYIAYNIAARSHSLAEIYSKLAYEGHPILWYAELYFLLPLIHSPLVLDVAALLNVSVMLWLVIFRSPFSTTEKILLLCGYYFLYEYSAISRSYTLVPPLLFGICHLLRQRSSLLPRTFYLWWGALCILLANVNIYSALLVLPLSMVCAMGTPKFLSRALLMSFAVVLIGGVVCSLMPPPSEMHSWDEVVLSPGKQILMALGPVGRAQLALTIPLHHVWTDYYDSGQEAAVIILGGMVFIFLQLWVLETGKRSFVAFMLGAGGVIAIVTMVNSTMDAAQRHAGHIWLLWIALLWVDYEVLLVQRSVRKAIFYGLFSLHAIAGIWMYGEDIVYPFSDAQAIVKRIEESAGSRYIFAAYPIGIAAAFTAHSSEEKPSFMYGTFGDHVILDNTFLEQNRLLGIKYPILPARETELVARQQRQLAATQKTMQVFINSELPLLLQEASKRCVPAFVITQRPVDITKSSVPLTPIFATQSNTLSDERWYAYRLTTTATYCKSNDKN